jgi:nitrate/nitrite-specific signal transduction histidine kinase
VIAGSIVTTRRQPPSFESVRELLAELESDAQKRAKAAAELESDVRELQQMLQTSERQNAQLTNLYVATFQLHASLELPHVQAAICEIAINLLGAEQYALLVRDEERQIVEAVVQSPGLELPLAHGRYLGGDALVDAGLVDGVLRLGPAPGSSVVAAVPLTVQGSVLGMLVIQRLLPQKAGLAAEDRELLDVMAAHAASALLAAKMFSERTRELRTLEGLMQLIRPPGGEP